MIINFIARLIWVFFPFLRLHSVRYLGFVISFSTLLFFLYLTAAYAPFFKKYIYKNIINIALILLKPKVLIFIILIGFIFYIKSLYDYYNKKNPEEFNFKSRQKSLSNKGIILRDLENRIVYDIANYVEKDSNKDKFDYRYKPQPYGLLPINTFYSSSNFIVKNVKDYSKVRLVKYFFDLEEACLFNGIFNWWFLNFQNLIKIFYAVIFFIIVLGLLNWNIDTFWYSIGHIKRLSLYFGSFRLSKAFHFLFTFFFISFFSVFFLTHLDPDRSSQGDEDFRALKRRFRSSWASVLFSFGVCVFSAGVFRINTKKIFVTRRQYVFLKKHSKILKFIRRNKIQALIKKSKARNSHDRLSRKFLRFFWFTVVKKTKRFFDWLLLKTELSDETPDWFVKYYKYGLKKAKKYAKGVYLNRDLIKKKSRFKKRVFSLNKKRYKKKRRRTRRLKKRKKRHKKKRRFSGVTIHKNFSLDDFLDVYRPFKVTNINKHTRKIIKKLKKKVKKKFLKKKKKKVKRRRRWKKRRGKKRRSKKKKKKIRRRRKRRRKKRRAVKFKSRKMKRSELERNGFINNKDDKFNFKKFRSYSRGHFKKIKSTTLSNMKFVNSGVDSASVNRFYKNFFKKKNSGFNINSNRIDPKKKDFKIFKKEELNKANFLVSLTNKIIKKINSIVDSLNKVYLPPIFYLPQNIYKRYFRKVHKKRRAYGSKRRRRSKKKRKKGLKRHSRLDRRLGVKDKHGKVGSDARLYMTRSIDKYFDKVRSKVRRVTGKYHNHFVNTPQFLKRSLKFNLPKLKKIDQDIFYNLFERLPFLRNFINFWMKFKKFLLSKQSIQDDYFNYAPFLKSGFTRPNSTEALFASLTDDEKKKYAEEFDNFFSSQDFKTKLFFDGGISLDRVYSKAEKNYFKIAFCVFKGDKAKLLNLIIQNNYNNFITYHIVFSKNYYFDTIGLDQSVKDFVFEKMYQDLYTHDEFFKAIGKLPKISNPFNIFSSTNNYRDAYWWYKLLFENVLGFNPQAYRTYVANLKKLDLKKKNFDFYSLQKFYKEKLDVKTHNIVAIDEADKTFFFPKKFLLTPMDVSKVIRILILKKFASNFFKRNDNLSNSNKKK